MKKSFLSECFTALSKVGNSFAETENEGSFQRFRWPLQIFNRCAILGMFVFIVMGSSSMYGFSPYENHLLSGEAQRVGLVSFVETKNVESLKAGFEKMSSKSKRTLEQAGVENLNLFVRGYEGRSIVFAYFEYEEKGLDGLDSILGDNASELKALETLLIPHDRAATGNAWLRMEWMNRIATDVAFPHSKKNIQKMALMSGLKPEREVTYRQLHQTNWPGVVDGMIHSNYRNWTTFLIEDGEDLLMFSYAEYIGEDLDADNKVMAADPPTQRWWKQTDPCQIDLHGEGNWSLMNNL